MGDAGAAPDARALWLVEPGRAEIRPSVLPERGAEDVLIRARLNGVSCGTESLVFLGRVPESQHRAMRCPFQEGDFPAPVKYGYTSVGVVEAGPDPLQGRRVFCLFPHQDRFVVPAGAVVPIPDDVPDARAALAANMETAVNAHWDAGTIGGDRIAVVGAGVVGCLVASLAARQPAAQVQLIDIDPGRAETARRLGVSFSLPDAADPDADLVFHASGTEAGLRTALALAGFEATVLDLSWYGDRIIGLPLGEAFHSRRLTLRSSQVGAVSPSRRARWTHQGRLALALDLLRDPIYDALLGGESAFDDLPATLARLATDPRGELCHIVRFP